MQKKTIHAQIIKIIQTTEHTAKYFILMVAYKGASSVVTVKRFRHKMFCPSKAVYASCMQSTAVRICGKGGFSIRSEKSRNRSGDGGKIVKWEECEVGWLIRGWRQEEVDSKDRVLDACQSERFVILHKMRVVEWWRWQTLSDCTPRTVGWVAQW